MGPLARLIGRDQVTMRSFDPDPSVIATASHGQRVHQRSLEHSARLMRTFCTVREGVWSLVGNGLSNQAFIEGPEGIIAIDTGGSCEEMTSALTELRAHTRAPIVAVIYTHFHYVNGTRAVFADAGRDNVSARTALEYRRRSRQPTRTA